LLSFLTVSDKILFECVSKQCKYKVFNKQQKLILNKSEENFDTFNKNEESVDAIK
jgi:hypothetical protein